MLTMKGAAGDDRRDPDCGADRAVDPVPRAQSLNALTYRGATMGATEKGGMG